MKIVSIISPYYDYLTASLMEGLQELGHEIISSEESNYTKKTPDRQLRKSAEKADWIIVGGNQRVRTWLVEDIENPNKVCIDGDDQQEFNVYPHILFKIVFKRELNRMWQNSAGEPVYPLPFAAEKRYFCNGPDQRTIKVAFAANMNANTMRYSVYQRLINKNDPRIFCGATGERAYLKKKCSGMPIETPKYREILSQAQIGVNVAGAGYDCARFWEILAAGAMLMTQELDIAIPHSFTEGLNCVVFRSLDEFDAKFEWLLYDPAAVSRIAEAGYQHLLRYHTTTARAAYFLDIVANVDDRKECRSFYAGPIKRSSANRFFLNLKK